MTGKLATPGVVVMLAGLALLYWGLGIVRGDTTKNAPNKTLGKK